MREDVKDLLERATAWFEPPSPEPGDVVRVHERRRRSARMMTVFFALAVFASAGVLTWVAFRQVTSSLGASPIELDARATLHGVSLEYPAPWTLVNLWPLASEIASWPEPGRSIDVPRGVPDRGGLPVLQLSNVDLGLRSVCGSAPVSRQAILYVAANGGPYLLNADGTARWSSELARDDGPCGPGLYAYRHSTRQRPNGTSEERPYLVFAAFGPEASAADRRVLFRVFDSLEFVEADDFLSPPTQSLPTYVIPAGAGPTATQVECVRARSSGDFDGDGLSDEAAFIEIVPAGIRCGDRSDDMSNLISQRIDVRFGSEATLEQPFTDCQPCLTGGEVFTATDLDGDGLDELAVDVGPGAAVDTVAFYRLGPAGMSPLVVAEPGDEPYVKAGPAVIGGSFDSGGQSPIECRIQPDGTRALISVHAENIGDTVDGPWRVHTTTLRLAGDRLVVTGSEGERGGFSMTSDVFENGCP